MRYLFHAFAALEVLLKVSLLWNSGHALGLTGSPALGMTLFREIAPDRGASGCHGGQIPSISADPICRDGQFHSKLRTRELWWGGAVTL